MTRKPARPKVSRVARRKDAAGKDIGTTASRSRAGSKRKSKDEPVTPGALERWENEGGRVAKPGTRARKR